ncbi:ATP-binding protein [Brachyspira hyodysenteriae]|uniref:AAA family ATPase n=1 Tax=Brachyspira hyodysenteriae TaxID=159 RepID=UPI00063D900E|nr:AAA family ATPase [Brachyspira hyodysenteriae]KLI34077.1 ABC transporter ATP-binding protein [Brachyspira hyodysenteriae]MBT8721118.1 ATP-binding protein [Brachyspira hyodysenteriae]MBT8731080.1 ATP-binding protein [Brachyspira hyodysenteriae]MBT8733947.1 ATP-binding protein [Brachyspira hyodysenteriae]MBT8736174.1 ATP-binding protein [Brachyspira hyodysenteriae]
MELNIKNFSKIKEANITIDGITVIAGENNTGKSTIGKILFSCFNSTKNIEEEIYSSKFIPILKNLTYLMQELSKNNESIKKIPSLYSSLLGGPAIAAGTIGTTAAATSAVLGTTLFPVIGIPLAIGAGALSMIKNKKQDSNNLNIDNLINNINNIISDLTNKNNKKNAYDVLKENLKEYVDMEDKKNIYIIKKYSDRIQEYINIPNKKIAYKIINDYFKSIFNNQINSRIDKDSISEINIMDLSFKFKNDKSIESKYNDTYSKNVYFIDNPFVLDKKYDEKYMTKYEYNLIEKLLYNTEEVNTTEQILAEEKLEEIYDKLSEAVNGKIINRDNDFYLEEENFTEPISIHSLSAGLKSFAVIKMLIEKNALKEEDILILDEPEIHLHPKWQLLYAEIIVLLQKIFNVYIIVTTHSPYFLEAIEMYSNKYDIEDKNNYYLSDIENNYAVFNLVNDSVEKIYSKMAEPIDEMEDFINN